MRKSDIVIGGRYAYLRNKWGAASEVSVVHTGDYGTLSKWLTPRWAGAIRIAAGLPDDAYVKVEDENAGVAIRRVLRDGTLEGSVFLVSPRFIKRTWAEQQEQDRVNAARWEEHKKRAAHDREVNVAHGQAFHAEAAEFLQIAEALGIVSGVQDHGFGGFRTFSGSGFSVKNSYADGYGYERNVTLTRDAISRLAPLLAAAQRLGLHLTEEVAA
jgi:hypothetical protein